MQEMKLAQQYNKFENKKFRNFFRKSQLFSHPLTEQHNNNNNDSDNRDVYKK